MKKMRFAIVALAVVALVGLTTAEVMAGPGCGGKTTTKASNSCGSKASATKADASAGCAATCTSAQKASAACSQTCDKATKTAQATGACGAEQTGMKACNYTEAECAGWMTERYKSHGWLGIEMNMDGEMPVLTRVVDGSPAHKGGFQVGDVLTSVNGIGFNKANETVLNEMYKNGFKIGQGVVYTANRDGSIVTLNAKLTKISDAALAQMITGHNKGYTHKAIEQAENIKS